jgi:ligand-binding sensor domain-containing protein
MEMTGMHFFTFNSELPSNNITSISIDTFQNIWVGTDSGVAKYDRTNWVAFTTENCELPSNNIHSISCENNPTNDIWIATTDGLVKLNDTELTIYNTTNSNIPSNIVSSIAFDHNGNKWFWTYIESPYSELTAVVEFDDVNWNITKK